MVDEVYNKAIVVNSKEVDKTYNSYQAALNAANNKIIKSLETLKAELNDPKKFVKLSISEKATSIAEVSKKIEDLNGGALAEYVAAQNRKDLFGVDIETVEDVKKLIIGKWKRENTIVELKKNGEFFDSRNISGTWTVTESGSFIMVWSDTGHAVTCTKPVNNISLEFGLSTKPLTKIN